MISIKIKICFIVMLLIEMSNAHGRLIEPIARSSAWRKYRAIKPYYDDNSMNCGGLGVQTITSRGKCSICGESYTTRKQFTKGRIVKSYTEGQLIKAVVEVRISNLSLFIIKINSFNIRLLKSNEYRLLPIITASLSLAYAM